MYYFENISEFKALMPSLFTSDELSGIGYSSYTDDDLKVILGRSEGYIDNLRYVGSFVEEYQLHAFPRKLHTGYVVSKNDERVLKALCMVAFDYITAESSSSDSRETYIRQGVKSISTGGVSESYGTISEVENSKVSSNYAKYLGFCLFKGIL